MSSINDKMQNPGGTGLSLSPANIRKAGTDIRALGKALGMDTMQVLILTAIIHNSSRYHINGEAVADYLGMGYIKFLTYSKEMDELRARGYIRLDKDGDIIVPREVLNSLKANSPVEPEPISGLTTAQILSRIRRKLSIREDDEMTTPELLNEIDTLMRENPDTSIGRVYRERIQKDIYKNERIVFAVLLYRYYYLEDDIIGWHNLDDYFEDFEFDDLKGDYMAEQMDLQRRGIIEHTGVDGILSKDYFKIKDEIKEEALADVGGLKVKAPKVSASRRIEAGAITEKELFYNAVEERQVSQLRELMSEQRFADIRSIVLRLILQDFPDNVQEMGPALCRRDEFLHAVAEQDAAHLIVVKDGAEGQGGGNFGNLLPLGLHGRSKESGARDVHQQHHREFPLLLEHLHVRGVHPGGHVPVHVAHVVSPLILPNFAECHAASLERGMVFAGKDLVAQRLGLDLNLADLLY